MFPWRAPVRPQGFTCILTGRGCRYDACLSCPIYRGPAKGASPTVEVTV